ncbi:hypothetical protein RhiirA5_408008 [Rhizophagus irregularis]|uniref:Uncharacterized protein n=1 Tax=Rhizophagus irregularis TaxID=588596 RepID=A0A2N0Q927_9GLOM|nr:hypothetical protein RhiirA5_408008 [Rhizophagus irregularis]
MVELLTKKFEIKHNLSTTKLQEDKQWDDKIPLVSEIKPILLQKLNHLFKELPFQRNIAKEEILRSQKEYYDGKGKRKEEFKIDDEVLKYNAAQQNSNQTS